MHNFKRGMTDFNAPVQLSIYTEVQQTHTLEYPKHKANQYIDFPTYKLTTGPFDLKLEAFYLKRYLEAEKYMEYIWKCEHTVQK